MVARVLPPSHVGAIVATDVRLLASKWTLSPCQYTSSLGRIRVFPGYAAWRLWPAGCRAENQLRGAPSYSRWRPQAVDRHWQLPRASARLQYRAPHARLEGRQYQPPQQPTRRTGQRSVALLWPLIALLRLMGYSAPARPAEGAASCTTSPRALGLRPLSRKCGFATFLDPRGGRAGRSPALGALKT